MQLGAVERLVGVDVPDARDAGLGQQERLQRRGAALGDAAERLGRQLARERLDPHPGRQVLVQRVAALDAESPVPKRRTSVKSICEPSSNSTRHLQEARLRRGLVEPRRAEPRVGLHHVGDLALGVGRAQQHVARHPQVQDERPLPLQPRSAGTCRAARRPRSRRPFEPLRHRPAAAAGRVRRSSRISAATILLPRDLGRELAPDRLDLGQLGHEPEATAARLLAGPRVRLEVASFSSSPERWV